MAADTDPGRITAFLESVESGARRADAKTLFGWMKKLAGLEARLWSDSIVGFGSYRYRYATGREGEWFRIGFAPRAQGISLYLISDFEGEEELMKQVGKHKMGRSCMTFKRLDDLNTEVLRELIAKAAKGVICSEVKE